MILEVILAGVLGMSLAYNLAQFFELRRMRSFATQALRDEQAGRRAEVTGLLNRMKTNEITLERAEPEVPPLSEHKPYISDLEYDDELWEDRIALANEGKEEPE